MTESAFMKRLVKEHPGVVLLNIKLHARLDRIICVKDRKDGCKEASN